MNELNLVQRKRYAQAIYWLTLLAYIAVVWQGIRFLMGDIGLEAADQFIASINHPIGDTSRWDIVDLISKPIARIFWYMGVILWHMIGLLFWGHIGSKFAEFGTSYAHYIRVGAEQYAIDCAAAEAAREAEEKHEARLMKKLDARDNRREKERAKSCDCSGSLLVGLLIGWWLL